VRVSGLHLGESFFGQCVPQTITVVFIVSLQPADVIAFERNQMPR